ncbi:hypothetical protein DHB64_17605 [Antarcticibacterium sp. W02-3]|nr:hypothetical protein [Antarcticibacterium sp. W02-3]
MKPIVSGNQILKSPEGAQSKPDLLLLRPIINNQYLPGNKKQETRNKNLEPRDKNQETRLRESE